MVTQVSLRIAVCGVALQAACILHHLYTALAKVLHRRANTTGDLRTEQCVHYKEADLYLTTTLFILHHLYTALAKVHVNYKEVGLYLEPSLYSSCQGPALTYKSDLQSGDRTVHVDYKEVDMYVAHQ